VTPSAAVTDPRAGVLRQRNHELFGGPELPVPVCEYDNALRTTDSRRRLYCVKRALKGEFEDSLWEHLAGTTSAPFVAGERERIAVKVIDDRGNELLVVKPFSEAV
jgi:adenine-specific DNA-methyltransferase